MKQDFHSFFQEPELQSSSRHGVAQHLMPSSEALMGYPNPHMEAGQILQALSASEIPVLRGQDGG